MKRVALIGHRGVGKTSLLTRIADYYKAAGAKRLAITIDLDSEIQKQAKRTIQEIFAQDGESEFRRIERETFVLVAREIANVENDVYVSLGAGFDPRNIDETWQVLWARRASDERGRIFTDRPRLNPDVSALDEFQQRFVVRQPLFDQRADQILWVDEGLYHPDPAEHAFFTDQIRELGGALTLLSQNFQTEGRFQTFASERVKWGIRWFELRDDLLSAEQIAAALRMLPHDRVLMSFRKPESIASTHALIEKLNLAYDWPLELGPCQLKPNFLSLHERREGASITETLKRFSGAPEKSVLKAALPVRDFADLREGHLWQMADPDKRVFLPMSSDGRWTWYRNFRGNDIKLNFFREAGGSSVDQPTLLQWMRARKIMRQGYHEFAAVLGDPVAHSRTPIEQRDFFARAHAPVFAIRVAESEWALALNFLKDLGLRWAAVTAPLKHHAYASSAVRDELCTQLQSANTIQWQEGWSATNTDYEGFREALKKIKGSLGKIAIWGGGGTLKMVQASLPKAEAFSVRDLTNRENGTAASQFRPDTVVWAVGGERAKINAPPREWRPRLVIDLNYGEDSLGRDFAVGTGAKYFSGLKMFEAQANAQRRFWKSANSVFEESSK